REAPDGGAGVFDGAAAVGPRLGLADLGQGVEAGGEALADGVLEPDPGVYIVEAVEVVYGAVYGGAGALGGEEGPGGEGDDEAGDHIAALAAGEVADRHGGD